MIFLSAIGDPSFSLLRHRLVFAASLSCGPCRLWHQYTIKSGKVTRRDTVVVHGGSRMTRRDTVVVHGSGRVTRRGTVVVG